MAPTVKGFTDVTHTGESLPCHKDGGQMLNPRPSTQSQHHCPSLPLSQADKLRSGCNSGVC